MSCKKFCKEYKKKILEKVGKNFPYNKTDIKNMKCNKVFCNKSCKGTILESKNKFPTIEFKKNRIFKKTIIKSLKNCQQEIFKNRNNVLVDNVYYKIPKKTSKKYKDKGAISICLPMFEKSALNIYKSKTRLNP